MCCPNTAEVVLGSQLLERLEGHLHERGVDDLILGALAGNTDAIRLYERRGYQPTWLYLSKFAGRHAVAGSRRKATLRQRN